MQVSQHVTQHVNMRVILHVNMHVTQHNNMLATQHVNMHVINCVLPSMLPRMIT